MAAVFMQAVARGSKHFIFMSTCHCEQSFVIISADGLATTCTTAVTRGMTLSLLGHPLCWDSENMENPMVLFGFMQTAH